MKNSELLAYTGSDNLLTEMQKQTRYVLRIESRPMGCSNCGTLHAKWEIHGITDVDDYNLRDSHGDEGKCKGCDRAVRYCVPFVGDPYLSVVPDPSLATQK